MAVTALTSIRWKNNPSFFNYYGNVTGGPRNILGPLLLKYNLSLDCSSVRKMLKID